MDFSRSPLIRIPVLCLLIALFTLPPNLLAQSHVVNQADLHKELVNATQTRQKNLEKVKRLFSSDEALKALESAQDESRSRSTPRSRR